MNIHMSQEERDKIYKKWESWYDILELDIKYCYKWLRDEYVSEIAKYVDNGEHVIVEGPFRSGKTSLAIYFAKLKELGRAGKVQSVGFIDMVEIDKKKDDEFSWAPLYDNKKIKEETENKNIIILDELYYPQCWENVVEPLLDKFSDEKIFVIFLHSHLKYDNYKQDMINNIHALNGKRIILYSYSETQEDMILNEIGIDNKEIIKKNLRGNRIIYNTMMHNRFHKGVSAQEINKNYINMNNYLGRYFIQENLENQELIQKACLYGKLTEQEKQRLFDFGFLSRRKNNSCFEEYLPLPIIKKYLPDAKEALIL
ncbi:MAG: ATP-binding protein [Candidatus Aenigmarchaeota archaeon]|nr:ATP-binding protein [Candidatus Aenigmarchaeota archaeon]